VGKDGDPLCSMCDERAYMFRRMRNNGILKPMCTGHFQQDMEWLLDHNRGDFSLSGYIPVADGRQEWEIQSVMVL
jgi:hypothetical protein